MDAVKHAAINCSTQGVCFSSAAAAPPDRYAPDELPHKNHCGSKKCSPTCCMVQINTQMRQDLGIEKPAVKKHPSGFLGNLGAFFKNLGNDFQIIFGLKRR